MIIAVGDKATAITQQHVYQIVRQIFQEELQYCSRKKKKLIIESTTSEPYHSAK